MAKKCYNTKEVIFMKKNLIAMIIIAAMLVGGLTYIGFYLSKTNQEYYELEKALEDAAKQYYGQFPGELPSRSRSISSARLINERFLAEFNEECSGYVEVKKSGNFYNYKAFVNCPNYTTKGHKPIDDYKFS